eukprot:scaffold7500_cov127-Isochrysis_galbana.AAC.27
MTDPPTDDTKAREPDAPDPTDAKPHAPLHGHTGGVPSDKSLSGTVIQGRRPFVLGAARRRRRRTCTVKV